MVGQERPTLRMPGGPPYKQGEGRLQGAVSTPYLPGWYSPAPLPTGCPNFKAKRGEKAEETHPGRLLLSTKPGITHPGRLLFEYKTRE